VVKPDPELEALRKQYDQALQEFNDLRERLQQASDEARTNLLEQQRTLDSALQGLKSEIESRGGSVAPETVPEAPPVPETEPVQPEAPPGIHLQAPPKSIDEQWNKLVEEYEDALKDAAEHATTKQDDWTCGDLCRGGEHNGCAIWWRGYLDVLTFRLRDAAHKLLEDLAGPSTQDEIAAGNVVPRIRKQVEEVDEKLDAAEENLQKLIDQFLEDEKTYKAIREAGGDLGTATGVFSAGRSRLLHDIYQARKLVDKLNAEKHKLLGEINKKGGKALELRRERGLERAVEGRYGWDGVDLDFDGLKDDEMIRRLLGPEQYESMQEEREKQGTQMRIGRRDGASRAGALALFASIPPAMWLSVLAVLLLIIVGGILLFTGSGDSEPEDSAAQSSAGDAGITGVAAAPHTTETAVAELTATAAAEQTASALQSATTAIAATQEAAASATSASATQVAVAFATSAAAAATEEAAATVEAQQTSVAETATAEASPEPGSELPPGDLYNLNTGWTVVVQVPSEIHAGQPFTFTYYVYDPNGSAGTGTAEASAGVNGDFTAAGASHSSVQLVDGCAMFTLNPTVPAGGTVNLGIYYPQAAPVPLTVAEITVLP
jgi:hypothetical protein